MALGGEARCMHQCLVDLLVPFVRGQNGLGQCVEQHTAATLQRDQNAWIEPLSPYGGRGRYKQWCSPAPPTPENSQRISAVPGRVPRLLSLGYTVALLFVVEKMALCRSDICVGFICWVV